MKLNILARTLDRLHSWYVERHTQREHRHGLVLSMYIEAAPLDTRLLWSKLHAALDLIASHTPIWIERMRTLETRIDVRRIPGTRAMLVGTRQIVLDPYLLQDFQAAQIASSILHEATHAFLHARGKEFDAARPARDERACRRSELRFGRVLRSAGVPGANEVIERATAALAAPDDEVGVVIDWQTWRAQSTITRINDLPVPRWLKRVIARRAGVLDTPPGRAAFGG